MPELDLLVRGGKVVTPAGMENTDIGIARGRIVALQPAVQATSHEVIDAEGLHVLPGLIDAHVHFNEPGRAEWEGFETGTKAFAAGGGTLFFDMPLNAHPPTVDAESFKLKLEAAKGKALVDFAFWGGLVPGNLDKLEELSDCGVVGFKAFMSNSGIEDFQSVDDHTLKEGMKRAKKLGRIVAVHAESDAMTQELSRKYASAGKTSIRDYLDSRPIEAELEAIEQALDLAGETGCALHIVHVSCGAGILLIAAAKKLGLDVTCETCPHYLTLTEEDVVRLGAVAKCAPPLRSLATQDTLWEYVKTAQVTTIGSDHSPAPPGMKLNSDFFKVWGGISGVQHTWPLLITEGYVKRGAALELLSRFVSINVAERFKLPQTKNGMAVGSDADLVLVDLEQEFTIERADLLYRHQQSPYVGRTVKGRVVQTLLRGQSVFKDGKIVSKPIGQFVKI